MFCLCLKIQHEIYIAKHKQKVLSDKIFQYFISVTYFTESVFLAFVIIKMGDLNIVLLF